MADSGLELITPQGANGEANRSSTPRKIVSWSSTGTPQWLGGQSGSSGGLSVLEEDDLYFKVVKPSQSGHVFGCVRQQPIRERGESSNMAATRLTLEHQVTAFHEQLATVVEYMKKYMPPAGEANGDANRSSTPRTGASATGPARVQQTDLEASLDAVALLVNVANGQLPNQVDAPEGNDGAEEEKDPEYAAY